MSSNNNSKTISSSLYQIPYFVSKIHNITIYKKRNFKTKFFSNRLVLITTFKNMVIKFVGGSSVAKRSYVIIHSGSNIYSFASVYNITIARVRW